MAGTFREWWDKLVHVEAVSNKGRLVFLCMIMGITTLIMLVMSLVMLSWVPLLATLFGWAVVAAYTFWQSVALDRAGGAIASITVPSGGSTPSVAQHSNIETMVTRGEYTRAAEAYKAIISADPRDIVACEKLAQLAHRELKDYDTAVYAWHEAEKRSPEPRRQQGYAMLAAGILRDNKKDYGKTIVELRRILARYPGVPNAERLRAEIDELKAIHFEGK